MAFFRRCNLKDGDRSAQYLRGIANSFEQAATLPTKRSDFTII